MKPELRQSILLIIILAVSGLVIALVSTVLLYNVAVRQQGLRLQGMARNEARLIEAMAEYEGHWTEAGGLPAGHGDAYEAVISQLRAARAKFGGFGRTGELKLGVRIGDSIVYLAAHRGDSAANPAPVPWTKGKAQPMYRALDGQSGVGVLIDYHGVRVLAAYEPVRAFGLGVVAKLDLAEVQGPFVDAGLLTLAATLVFVIGGGLLLLGVTAPERRRLRAAEEEHLFFATVFENMLEGVCLIQVADDVIVSTNPKFDEMFGYGPGELVGKHISVVNAPTERKPEEVTREITAGLARTGRWVGEVMNVRKDGTVFRCEAVVSPLGHPRYGRVWLAIHRDITERRRAEETLRASGALLQAAVNILPVGLWIIDAEGEIVTSSAAAQRIWAGERYVGTDQLGKHKGWRTDGGKLIEAHEWAGARALETGKTATEAEVEIECFDGTHKIILDSAVPLRRSDGSIVGAIAINQDITERKQAEERDRQHLKDTALLRDTAVGFIQLDPGTDVYQYVANHLSALVGEAHVIINSYDEVADEFTVRAIAGIGTRVETVLKVVNRNPVGTVFTVANEHRTEYASEKLMKFEDGLRGLSYGKLPKVLTQTIEKTFDIGGVYAMGFHWQGRVLGTLNLIMRRGADVRDPAIIEAFINQAAIALQHRRDADELDRHRIHLEEMVTERTRELTAAQEQLVLQEKLATVGRVAGSVAHELRNPLGAIRNASFYLQMTAAPKLEGKQLRHLQVIDEYVDRANKAISMILDFTQGRQPVPAPCALQSILQRAVTDASLPPNVKVLITIPPRLPQVLADDGQIVVVFRNLLTNAGRAMPGGGTVKIQARAGQDGVVVDVTDTGTGVKPEHMASLFKPLFTTGEIGIGLGLSICQGFVRSNKGTISVVSELGKGTTFTVTLPTAA